MCPERASGRARRFLGQGPRPSATQVPGGLTFGGGEIVYIT
jgi:hypothetical protein